ncbi:MAG: hypothetical protein E7551_00870 [Ruminococcaceae bacterium]|nr:hypothetical protein [Oscillospiraceae bacterium]
MNCNKKVTVTCWYCKFHNLYYELIEDFNYEGYCVLKNISKSGLDKICEEFQIKPCIHTSKYYPSKK